MSYKFDSLVSILNWLETGETVTPQYIQDNLEISERTAFRYVQTLECAGFPIYFDKRKGSYTFMDGYSLRKPHLTISESLALALAKLSLKSMSSGLDAELQHIEEKLAVTCHGLPEHIIIAGDDFATDVHELFLAINDAIVTSRTVEFRYSAASTGKETKREVDPYYLYFGDEFWTMRGFCHSRKEMRAFSLDRITGLKILGKRFVACKVNPKDEHDGTFGRFVDGDPVEVKLIFDKAAVPFLMRKKWHPSQITTERSDGRLDVQFTVNGILGIRPWIYRWLPNVIVEAPDELKELVRAELMASLEKNSENCL